jgi:hypothetical protein
MTPDAERRQALIDLIDRKIDEAMPEFERQMVPIIESWFLVGSIEQGDGLATLIEEHPRG